MGATLYVVATPLGNLGDISARVAACLRDTPRLYAEDTRRTRVLLEHLGIHKAARSLHSHNEGSRLSEILTHLEQGDSVALVSDAGTPAVSDPGAELVDAVHAAGFAVSPIVGPSALAGALSVAGFYEPAANVLFVGFLPARGSALRDAVARVSAHPGVVVLFESPHRVAATLAAMAEHAPDRPICLCRELTKVYEEVRRCSVKQLRDWAEQSDVLGEVTLVLGPSVVAVAAPDDAAIDAAAVRCQRAGLSARDTATAVAAILELPKRQVYERCVRLFKE